MLVNNHSRGVLLTDNDKGISSAFNQTFALYGSKHLLCLWHLFKNVMKNLQGVASLESTIDCSPAVVDSTAWSESTVEQKQR